MQNLLQLWLTYKGLQKILHLLNKLISSQRDVGAKSPWGLNLKVVNDATKKAQIYQTKTS